MTFDEVLAQIQDLLQREQRVSYRGLRRRFALDDEYLEDLKEELIGAKRLAIDEDGRFLVWVGQDSLASSVPSLASKDTVLPDPRPQTLDSRRAAAERRQLTVLFCDLVGSTTLSEQLDPEELQEVIQAYHAMCAGAITRYAGYTAQHLGDGLLVYFGYPTAHEDEAARAVRTALEILDGLLSLKAQLQPALTARLPHPIQVRIGIHTGLVVIGEIGGSEKKEILALGETPNLAARLQGLAEPDTVVISAATQHLVQGLFEHQNLGAQHLKGLSTPVAVYRVMRESEAQNRFEAAVHKGLTPLVGRSEELALLQQRWERAKQGAGQAVLLSGEPGIGKSRLVQALKEQVLTESAACIEFHCSPYHQNSALHPIIDHLQRLLQFTREDSSVAKLEKLQYVLARYRFPQAETVPLLAALLSLPHPESYPPITVSPQKQREKTHAALVAWLIEEAEQRPVCTVWEDLHWADPSTLEVLALLLDQAPTARLLVLLTFRPEFAPPWGSRSYLMQLTLNRLGHVQVREMVSHVAEQALRPSTSSGRTELESDRESLPVRAEPVEAQTALPKAFIEAVVAKTDGVPLFVEELTKTVVETIGAHPDVSSLQMGVPSTLQDALMARLDRLGPAKEIAQLSATLGREFSYELLHAIANRDEDSLQPGLRQLVEAELLYQRGLPPQATYLFKHALIQDTAYQSLLKSKRQQLHQQIAQVLAERFPETVETQPELLAHHYTEAGLAEQAVPYWQQAGQRASQRSSHVEAISHLTKGLTLLKTLPNTPECTQQELMLQVALGAPLIATKGYAAQEVEQAYAHALELCRLIGETVELFHVLAGLRTFYAMAGRIAQAYDIGKQLLTFAQRAQEPSLLLEAYFQHGNTLFWMGEFKAAQEHFDRALSLDDPDQSRRNVTLYARDTRVASLVHLAMGLWILGYPVQALQRAEQALARGRECAHPFSLTYGKVGLAWVRVYRYEGYAAQQWAEAIIALGREQGFPFWTTNGTIILGWARAKQGQREEGIEQMRQGVDVWRAMGAENSRPFFLALLAEAYGDVRQPEKGLTVLVEGLAQVERTGERCYEAELYRLKGELTLQQENQKAKGKSQKAKLETEPRDPMSDAQGEAEACFLKAIEVARKQQAKSLELRAAMSLTRLWQQQGKKDEARQILAEIYGWFTEGFDTKDLQEAKVLLEELA